MEGAGALMSCVDVTGVKGTLKEQRGEDDHLCVSAVSAYYDGPW